MIFNPVRYGGGGKVYTREGQSTKYTSAWSIPSVSFTLTFDEPVQAFYYWGDGYYKGSSSGDFSWDDVSGCLFGPIADPNLGTEFYPYVLAGRSGNSKTASDAFAGTRVVWASDRKSATITVENGAKTLGNYFDLSGNTYHYIGIPADS